MAIIIVEGTMVIYLKPDLYYKNIFEVDFSKLKQQGIKGIICDIDNTIVPWHENEIMIDVLNWFNEIKGMSFRVCLVSNGLDRRVKYFSKKLDIPGIGRAIKPRKKAYLIAIAELDINKDKIAVIGDQIFTDILGGNRLGLTTILVDPMNKKEFITTKFLRIIEKMIFKRNY